jgi:hypothetical protein
LNTLSGNLNTLSGTVNNINSLNNRITVVRNANTNGFDINIGSAISNVYINGNLYYNGGLVYRQQNSYSNVVAMEEYINQ